MKSHPLALVSAIILALCIIPANAATLNRTWVSATTGANGSSCGAITSPCLTFQGALTNTAAGGEIDCLTPGDFGAVTISQSVSIICDGVSNGGIQDTNGTPIIINAPTGGVVYLSGLNLSGMGTGLFGLVVNTGSTVYIVHSTIRGFKNEGVFVNSTTNPTRVVIKDAIIVNNAGGGVLVEGYDGATNGVILLNAVVDGNGNYAAEADGAHGASVIALIQSELSGSPIGLNLVSGGTGEFIGPSNLVGGDIVGSPTSVDFK